MNLLSKTTPWVVAVLLASTSAFGQDKCMPRPDKGAAPCDVKEMNPGMPGYNAPSGVNVCGSWDVNLNASFLYWRASQDNMDIAFANKTPITNLNVNGHGYDGNFVQMNFGFKPGFRVGVGFCFEDDNWEAEAAYTRVHGKRTTTSNGPSGGLLMPTVGAPTFLSQSQAFATVKATYNCNLDFIDAVMGRCQYVGKSLTTRTVTGVRAAWILQDFTVNYNNPATGGIAEQTGAGPDANVDSEFSSVDVISRVHSWGLGPRMGFEANWNVGQGIRFFNSEYLDILYTHYVCTDKTVYNNFASTASGTILTGKSKAVKTDALRPHLDLEFGFGWGSYFDNSNWHVDLSAAYGFQVFFDQNMFRHFDDSTIVASSQAPHGNLYVQGLTATVRFDF